MPHRRKRAIVVTILPAALLCGALAAAAEPPSGAAGPYAMGRAAPAKPAAGKTPAAADPYAPAKECAACHQAIHRQWAGSQHATSASDPAFLESLKRAVETAVDKEAVRQGCVWCHAPTTLMTGDFALKEPVSREGITCDFCHTVEDVDLDHADRPFVMKPGPVKRGPLEYASSPGHQTAYSPLHRASPLLCAACHEHTNAHGVAVLSNYSEWKAGPYPARGVPCQDCHMALVPGTTVREDLKGASLRVINLHRLVGGSSKGQLARALDLKIDSLAQSGGSAELTVVVTNVASGHAVPGGLSTKSLVLAVGVETAGGSLRHRQERIYRREMKDSEGRVLETVADLFLRAATVASDTRIKPRESRTERFTVPIPEGATAVVARLEYRDVSNPTTPPKTTLITEVRRDLAPR